MEGHGLVHILNDSHASHAQRLESVHPNDNSQATIVRRPKENRRLQAQLINRKCVSF